MFFIVKFLVIAFEIFEVVVALFILVAFVVAKYFDRLLRRCLFDDDSNFISFVAITIVSISFFLIAISKILICIRNLVDLRNLVDFRNFLDFCSLLLDFFLDFCNFFLIFAIFFLIFFLTRFFCCSIFFSTISKSKKFRFVDLTIFFSIRIINDFLF